MKKSILLLILCFAGAALSGASDASVFERFLCTDYTGGRVLLFEHGEVVWSHEAPMSNDLWLLPNGNVLFTTGHGVLEMTLWNDTIFHYESDSYIFACQRLENGCTFVGECNTGRLLEVAPDGRTVVNQLCILPPGVQDAGMSFIRNARRLDNGHYLVAHYAGRKVVEYAPDGSVVWEADVPGGAHSVMRLRNGHTMVSAADADQNPRLMEFSRRGRLVWEFSNRDIEGSPLKFLGGMYALKDGSLVFANWQGHGTYEGHPHLLHVNRKKQLIDSYGFDSNLRTVSSVVILDSRWERLSMLGH